ncbi:MAG: hypothetical protein ABI647_15210 [Gemmatimonadota bacterium]
MARRTWLFGPLLAVPRLGLGVAQAVNTHLNSELRSALRARHSELTESGIAALTLDRICPATEPPD